MISYETVRDSGMDNKQKIHFYGLSTDEKPVEEYDGIIIANSSTWRSIDNGEYFAYDETGKAWHKWETGGSGGDPDDEIKHATVTDGNLVFLRNAV